MITAVSVKKRLIGAFIALAVAMMLIWWIIPSKKSPSVNLPAEKIKVFELERLDLSLTQDDSLTENDIAALRMQYGEMFDTYVEEIISLCPANDPAISFHLNNFLNDPYIDSLFRDVKASFEEQETIEKELSAALSHFYFHFPTAPRYRMLGMVGAFQYKHALTDSGLMFGLDLHLGRNYRFYPKVRFLTKYMLPRLDHSYLVADGIKLLIDDLTPAVEKDQLLEEMIRAGKILYFTKLCMPALPDSVLLGFTADQTKWAQENERNMWEYLLDGNHLFSSDPKVISRFMSDGPFTAGLPEGCPARMASYTGLKIVERFISKFPKTDTKSLLQEPAAAMLKKSGYKGRF